MSQKVLNYLLAIGCVYEVFALATRKVPTITRILRLTGSSHPLGRALIWLWVGYVSWHFLEPLES